jgi:LysR family hydrogen peroxide-inducible transcriptional activator
MINLTLKQMRYFDALARQGHFGRAADACAISQPALSMQIQEMERTLGMPLLERGARGVTLTPFGQDVLGRLREVSADRGRDRGHRARGARLAVRRGAAGRDPHGRALRAAADRRPGLTARYPGLDLHLRETVTSRLIGELAEGSLDAAILALPVGETAFEEVPLFTEPSFWSAPARSGAARCPAPNVCAKCGSCCWRKGIASATRPCRFAT